MTLGAKLRLLSVVLIAVGAIIGMRSCDIYSEGEITDVWGELWSSGWSVTSKLGRSLSGPMESKNNSYDHAQKGDGWTINS